MKYSIILLILLFAAAQNVCLASSNIKYRVGIANVKSESIYKGKGDSDKYLPYIFVSYDDFQFDMTGIKYSIVNSNNIKLMANTRYSSPGHNSSDSSYFNGMDDREFSVMSGFILNGLFTILKFKTSAEKDISGNHGGYVAKLAIGPNLPPINSFFPWMPFTKFSIMYGLKYMDESYVNYYYGVKSSEVNTYRSEYYVSKASSLHSFNTSISFEIYDGLMLNLNYGKEFLSKEIYNSPIVNKKDVSKMMISMVYIF